MWRKKLAFFFARRGNWRACTFRRIRNRMVYSHPAWFASFLSNWFFLHCAVFELCKYVCILTIETIFGALLLVSKEADPNYAATTVSIWIQALRTTCTSTHSKDVYFYSANIKRIPLLTVPNIGFALSILELTITFKDCSLHCRGF